MRIPTANIIIGFNREVMDRLFTAGATYTNLIKELTLSGTDDALLFDSQSNPNFISFEHTNGMGKSMKMVLTLIDPKGEFEKRFATDSIVKNIAGFSYNDDQNATDGVDPLAAEMQKDMRRAGKLYDDQFFDEFFKEYKASLQDKQLYVAYGSGNNLNLWSGPHKVVLTAAELSMKGARKITLTLSPTPTALQLGHRKGAYNERVNLDLAGLTMRTTGVSKNIKFKDILKQKPAYTPLEDQPRFSRFDRFGGKDATTKAAEVVSTLKKAGFDLAASRIEEFDFHAIVVDTLRDYIQKATNNPNVIVLLPNINIICRNLIENTSILARASSIVKGGVSFIGTGSISPEFLNSFTELGYKESFISTFLSLLGLKLTTDDPSDNKNKASPTGLVSVRQNPEKAADAKARFAAKYNDNVFHATLEKASNKGLPDHVQAVTRVIDQINKYSKESYQIQFGIFNETDIKVLDYWSKGFAYQPLFGGYRTFNTQKEAIIVGDQALIRDYLYGRKTLEKAFEQISGYQKNAVLAKNKQYKATTTAFTTIDDKYSTELASAASGLEGQYQDSLLASLQVAPIHPLDSIILHEDYQKGIRDLAFSKLKGSTPFGDISEIPDDFAFDTFKEITPHIDTLARNEGISIFRYNTSNPNVIDMKFKFGGAYLAQLTMGFTKIVDTTASLVTEGILPIGIGSLPIRTQGAAVSYMLRNNFSLGMGDEARQKLINEVARKISVDVKHGLGAKGNYAAATMVSDYLSLLEAGEITAPKSYVEIDQFADGNPQALMTDFMQSMYRKALQMTITTLPSFHLSNVWDLNSPCIVLAKDAAISQTSPPERTLINSFFSGQYKILGFTHTISTSKSESSFSLAKMVEYTEKKDDE